MPQTVIEALNNKVPTKIWCEIVSAILFAIIFTSILACIVPDDINNKIECWEIK